MSRFFLGAIVLCLAIGVLSCGGQVDDAIGASVGAAPDSGGAEAGCAGEPNPPVGEVTFRIHNPTPGPVYIRWMGQPLSAVTIMDGTSPITVVAYCGGSETCPGYPGAPPTKCGDQPSSVRQIPAGESVEVVWAGGSFVRHQCPGYQTGCQTYLPVAPRKYVVEVAGSRALSSEGGTTQDPLVLQGADLNTSDTNACTASVVFPVDTTARVVDVVIACAE